LGSTSFGSIVSFTSEWRLTGTATLTYTFEPPPEPSVVPLPGGMSLALGGLAVFGAVGHRRRTHEKDGLARP
jgi:MYXO-CTERM domain-containing protein